MSENNIKGGRLAKRDIPEGTKLSSGCGGGGQPPVALFLEGREGLGAVWVFWLYVVWPGWIDYRLG